MGRGTAAVVDPRLKVHDVRGHCVADASFMPRLVGDNTNASFSLTPLLLPECMISA